MDDISVPFLGYADPGEIPTDNRKSQYKKKTKSGRKPGNGTTKGKRSKSRKRKSIAKNSKKRNRKKK